MQEHWTCYQDSGEDMLTPKHLLKKSRIPKYRFSKSMMNCTRSRPCVDRERQDAAHGSEWQRWKKLSLISHNGFAAFSTKLYIYIYILILSVKYKLPEQG
jgi:hypothetical protein